MDNEQKIWSFLQISPGATVDEITKAVELPRIVVISTILSSERLIDFRNAQRRD